MRREVIEASAAKEARSEHANIKADIYLRLSMASAAWLSDPGPAGPGCLADEALLRILRKQ
jgi:hypothetical protein